MMVENVNPSEIEKFNAIANTWWDSDGPCKTLHDINPVRLEFIQQHTDVKDKQILDIGCGGGILTESLAKAGAHLTGLDQATQVITIAKQHAKQQKLAIDYQVASLEDYATIHPHQFDIVTCMELLEHVPNPAELIKACQQAVKPNGYVFFSTLNRTPKAYLYAILGAEYLLKLLPKHTHDYRQFIKPSELHRNLRAQQLQCLALQGFSYNPITRQAYLCRDIQVNYLVCCCAS